jgi:hypothetical protein
VLIYDYFNQLRGQPIKPVKVIVEKHPDGYIAYPLGVKGVVVGQGDTYEKAMADIGSAIIFPYRDFWARDGGDCRFRNVGCVLRTTMRSGAALTIVIPKLELGNERTIHTKGVSPANHLHPGRNFPSRFSGCL